MTNDYDDNVDNDEGECLDCGCDIYTDGATEFRCDTCRDHYDQDCGDDCPIICEHCKEHHFKPCDDECPYLFESDRFLTTRPGYGD